MKIIINTVALVGTLLLLNACGQQSDGGSADSAAAPAPSSNPAASSTPSGDMMALTTEIPPEQSEGTPVPMQVKNLDKAPKKTPTMNVPKGTVNLSKGKTVTSSDDFPIIGGLELITDGEKDAGEGYYVELMDGTQWAQIDLGASATIHAIWIWHSHSQKLAYHDVVVQISDDATFAKGVTTVFNNDNDNSSSLGKGSDNPYVESNYGKLISGKGTKGRYVRLYSAGNTSSDLNQYTEVEVYGIPGN